MKDKRFNCMKVASNSKSFMEFINYGVKKFNEELILDKNTKLGFICGFIDAEGCTKMGSIIVCQKDKIVLEKFMKMCESLNISDLKLKQYKNTKTIHYIYRLRIPTRFKYMLLDSHKVKRMMK